MSDHLKKAILWIIFSALIMFAFPWLVVTFIKNENGMAVMFILFFAVNPVFSVILGAFTGNEIKKLWWLPIIPAVFFLLGTWIFFDMGETVFLIYAFAYLALGVVSMLISAFVGKKPES